MMQLPLTKGYVALVDDDDYPLVSCFKWSVYVDKKTVYARRTTQEDGSRYTVSMHRFIMGITDPKIEVDHHDHDGLNCQRLNLRVATRSQNIANCRKTINGTSSRYKGVSWYKSTGKFQAKIAVNGKQIHLGYFEDQTEAALVYNAAALHHFQEFAYLNQIDSQAEAQAAA